jgi:hypothetical protein
MITNNFIQNMIEHINYLDHKKNNSIINMLQLIDYVVKNVNYDMLFLDEINKKVL